MKKIIQTIEETLKAISPIEMRKNPKASAKAFEIKRMIEDLKSHSKNQTNQGVLKYINPKTLLEN